MGCSAFTLGLHTLTQRLSSESCSGWIGCTDCRLRVSTAERPCPVRSQQSCTPGLELFLPEGRCETVVMSARLRSSCYLSFPEGAITCMHN